MTLNKHKDRYIRFLADPLWPLWPLTKAARAIKVVRVPRTFLSKVHRSQSHFNGSESILTTLRVVFQLFKVFTYDQIWHEKKLYLLLFVMREYNDVVANDND